MRVLPFVIPFAIVIALLGTVLTAQVAGLWSTSGRDSVDVANMTAADLKGWMTLQQVMDGLHLSREQLYAAGAYRAMCLPKLH